MKPSSALVAPSHAREPLTSAVAHRVGRPTKIFREPVVERIVAAIAAGNTYEAAASAGPVSVRTLYAWLARGERDVIEGLAHSPYAAFRERVESANLECERHLVAMWVGAMPSDWRAIAAFMERRYPARWRRPDTRPAGFEDHGGYREQENYLTDDEAADALANAMERWLNEREVDVPQELQSSQALSEPSPNDVVQH